MKILLISSPFVPTPPPTYGGTQRDVALIASEFVKSGHEVTIIASKKSFVEGCRMVETLDWHEGETFADRRNSGALLTREFWDMVIRHLTTEKEYDIVNSHAWLPGMPYDAIKRLCKQLCISIHGGGAAPQNSLFVSAAHRDFFKPTARFIHNPVDPARYEFQTEKERYLSFIGRLDHAKGIDLAIQISQKTGIQLRFGGNIPDKQFFDNAIKPHLNSQIQYVGQVGGREKSDLLSKSIAVLYPTRLHPEPFGRVPLEANACGTPAIAFRNGGLNEVVSHGKTGFLTKNDNEMAEAIKKLKEINPFTCRKWVEDNFNPRLIAERYLKTYEDLIRGERWG